MSFKPKTTTPAAQPADTSEAKWRNLTEALIFAAPYGVAECLRILEATGRPFSHEYATKVCSALATAILADYPRPYKLLSCHAANDDRVFRLRYGHLLPRRPRIASQSTRRMGPTPEARQEAADEIVSDW